MDTIITTEAWLPFLLQTSDAVFPTGAYAHSHGLEEMVRAGRVRDEAGLAEFLRQHVVPSAIHLDLPIVREARTAALADDWETFTSLDQMTGALRPARELREASLQIGRRRLAILAKLHPSPFIEKLAAHVAEAPLAGHHAPVWGAACAGMPGDAAIFAYFYQMISGVCMAAPKLIRIGQEGAQRVLATLLAEAPSVLKRSANISRDDIGWFDPVLDIASMRHEIADERLFIS